MPLTIKNHRIVEAKFHSGFQSTEVVDRRYVAIHYPGTDTLNEALSALKSGGKAYHVVIDRDGSLHQLAPFDRRTAHAGYSDWKGAEFLNHHSVAVSLVNAGKMRLKDGSYVSSLGAAYPPERLADGRPRLPTSGSAVSKWERFTDVQLAACQAVLEALARGYPSLRDIVGHDEISMGRRDDPGPLFPWDRFRPLFPSAATDLGPALRVKKGGAPLRRTHDPTSGVIATLPEGTRVHLRSSVYKERYENGKLVATTKTGIVAVARDNSAVHAGFMERSRLA